MAYILLYNDCQFTSHSTHVKGVFSTLDDALVGGRRTQTVENQVLSRHDGCNAPGAGALGHTI